MQLSVIVFELKKETTIDKSDGRRCSLVINLDQIFAVYLKLLHEKKKCLSDCSLEIEK